MAPLKSVLKSAVRPLRVWGGRFVIAPPPPPPDKTSKIIWKAAQLLTSELVAGDYLEFGVFQGESFAEAYTILHDVCQFYWATYEFHSPAHKEKVRQIWNDMRFFAFDSFQGLPEMKDIDARSADFSPGQYSCSVDRFLENLKRQSVDLTKVIAVPGWFGETCTEATVRKHGMKAASIVHIDCDLYESTKAVLKFVEPLMVDGTVLIFNDWYCFRGNPELGEQRAFREWAASKPD